MKQRILALLLLAALCIGLVACSSTPAEPTAPAETPSATTETPAATDEPADEPAEAPADEPADEPTEAPADEPAVEEPAVEFVTWPLAETTEYVMWQTSTSLPTGYTDYNELSIYQELEARTNLHWEWIYATQENQAEQFSLMLTSGDWADVFCGASAQLLVGGYDYSIEEEIIIDLLPLVQTYMPNYWGMLSSNEVMFTDAKTDEGHLPFLALITEQPDAPFLGYFVRQDWVEAAGMSELQTYDDWETLLAWAKEEKGIAGLFYEGNILRAGFDAHNSFVAKDHATVEYSPITQEYYNYLEKMANWYAMGYLDPDFTSRGMYYTLGGLFAEGQFALFPTINAFYDMLSPQGQALDPDFNMVGAYFPRQNADDVLKVPFQHNAGTQNGAQTSVSTTCENPEIVLQYFDWLFSEEAAYLANYGVEGTHYTLNEDGFTITPTELATAETEVNKTYALMTYVPHLILSRTTSVSSEGVQQASEAWGHHWDPANNITMPGNISLSAEEAETNTYLTDVDTYVQEYTLRVITGQDDLASTWDSYVEAIYQMNIQDCIDAYQAAYTRYINR